MGKSTIIGIIAVIIIAGGGFLLLHKPSSTANTTNNSAYSAPSTSNTTTPPAASSGAIIETKTSSSLGQYLSDGSGKTLYTYGADTSGVSNCSGSCLSTWPAYVPSSTSASLPSNVTVIKRSDGSSQYAYKGMPLYYFASDSTGQVTGDSVNNFHAAKP